MYPVYMDVILRNKVVIKEVKNNYNKDNKIDEAFYFLCL